jgi:hypothetical protein
MRPTVMPFSHVIAQERRRWIPFRRALSKEDQEAFDRMFVCAKQQVQAEVLLGRPWKFADPTAFYVGDLPPARDAQT